MKIHFNKNLGSILIRNSCLLFTFLFLLEMLVRLVTNTFLGYGILRIAISSMILAILISLISSFFNKRVSIIINIIFL